MKTSAIFIFLGVSFSTSAAFASGETKALAFRVDETTLQGYVDDVHLGHGWVRHFIYGAATPTSAASQAIYAVSSAYDNGGDPLKPPPRAGVTLLSLAGDALAKESLPAAVQVRQGDCVGVDSTFDPPLQNICPSLGVTVVASKAFPGRLEFTIRKPAVFQWANLSFPAVTHYYVIFDPSAPVGSVARWLIADTRVSDAASEATNRNEYLPERQSADIPSYVFSRVSPTQTDVYKISAK